MRKIIQYVFFSFVMASVFFVSGCGEPSINNKEIFSDDLEPLSEEELAELESDEEFSDDELVEYKEEELEAVDENEAEMLPEEVVAPLDDSGNVIVEEEGAYSEKYKVATYLYQFEHLPDNYMTTEELKGAGWDGSSDFSKIVPDCNRGGDIFENQDKMLPEEPGMTYYQCDVNGEAGQISQEILIYNLKGTIYYSGDNGKTFEQIY